MVTKEPTVAELPVRLDDAVAATASARIVTIVSLSPDGTLHVRVGPNDPSVPARLAVRTTRERIETAVTLGQQAVVLFENCDRTRPIVVGLIETLPPPQPAAIPREADLPPDAPFVEADVDGRRVRLTAQDEIVLQCGSASITLRRNGRVVVRGTYVETHSDGTNRIKGGQVQIN